MRAALLGLMWVCTSASAAPCSDRLDSVHPATAAAGDEIELLGEFSAERGARRPMANRGGTNDLEVIAWTPQRIVARLPGKLDPGGYKVGIYCDGRPGPQRFVYSTDWLDFDVGPAPPPPEKTRSTHSAAAIAAPKSWQFEAWLGERPRIANELVWEEADGPMLYRHWSDARRGALYRAFTRALQSTPPATTAPPNNFAADLTLPQGLIRQQLGTNDAESIYLDAVGHSLALEYRAALPWSLSEYPLPQLEILLDGREFFSLHDGRYEIDMAIAGMALPSAAATHWAFLETRLGRTRRDTIVAVLDWLRDHAMHFEGAVSFETMQSQWQYPGFPPSTRVLEGTPHLGRPTWPQRPRTAGCFGTAGFLRALLRAANIPVRMESSCAHFQVHFPSEDLYLSHGDDPYNSDFRDAGCSSDRLLLDRTTFEQWFKRGPEPMRCANIGRGSRDLDCH